MTKNYSLKVPNNVKISIHIIYNKVFIVSSTYFDKRYICVPHFITSSKNGNKLIFKSKLPEETTLTKFINQMTYWLRLLERPSRKKIFLKGLGYKANLSENKEVLNLKIGLSHPTNVFILSNRIHLKINKNIIAIKGNSPTEVGDFAERIRKLRFPDSYKGKGIWYKNEIRILKVLKKK